MVRQKERETDQWRDGQTGDRETGGLVGKGKTNGQMEEERQKD